MLWRLFTVCIIAFWLVMTVLLVRVTYYPEGSQFAKVPPGAIFKMFLERGATQNTLHIYHNDKKVGYATLTPHRTEVKNGPADYVMMLQGTMDKGSVELADSQVVWHLNLELHGAERWGGMNGWVRMADIGTAFDFNWPEGESLPKFTLRGSNGYLDDKMLRTMMPFMAGSGAPSLPPGIELPKPGSDATLQVKAREGVMKLAGQKRRGYVMELSVMEQHRAKAYFTEAGDLALVEMPGGWRALDPLIYGLVPEIPEPEE